MIQRWTFDGPPAYPYENGGYVTYADHVAAIAAAEQALNARWEAAVAVIDGRNAEVYALGVKETLDAATEVVAAMRPETDPDIAHVIVSDVLDVIAALKGAET